MENDPFAARSKRDIWGARLAKLPLSEVRAIVAEATEKVGDMDDERRFYAGRYLGLMTDHLRVIEERNTFRRIVGEGEIIDTVSLGELHTHANATMRGTYGDNQQSTPANFSPDFSYKKAALARDGMLAADAVLAALIIDPAAA